jgi:hypothetical protein
LRNGRVGIKFILTPAGKEIGIARVYDFALESGSYEFENQALNRWDISLFDVQTYGDLTINEPITLNTPTYIRGDSSGATAFLKMQCICWNCSLQYIKFQETLLMAKN